MASARGTMSVDDGHRASNLELCPGVRRKLAARVHLILETRRMARRTHEIQVPLLEDKINILDWKIAEASPATQQVFIIVRSILTLVRVSALVLCPSAPICRLSSVT